MRGTVESTIDVDARIHALRLDALQWTVEAYSRHSPSPPA
jgi:hypothetical protein